MEHVQLKYCPHCNGTASLNANYSYKTRCYFVFAKCDICGAQGKIFKCDENPAELGWNSQPCNDAVAAWNMRAHEP